MYPATNERLVISSEDLAALTAACAVSPLRGRLRDLVRNR
jgi:hypothetical protein